MSRRITFFHQKGIKKKEWHYHSFSFVANIGLEPIRAEMPKGF